MTMEIRLQTNSSGNTSSNNSISGQHLIKNPPLFQSFRKIDEPVHNIQRDVEHRDEGSLHELNNKPKKKETKKINQSEQRERQQNQQEDESSSKTSKSQDVNSDSDKGSKIKMRVVGGVVMAILIAVTVIHAFTSTINKGYFNTNTSNVLVGAGLMVTVIFVVLGFGLSLAYYGQSIHTAFFTVLYTVAMTLLIEPFVTKFWVNLFFHGFIHSLQTWNTAVTILLTSNYGDIVSINYWNMRLAMNCAISQLLMYFVAVGRIQVYKVMITNFAFILMWSLNFSLVTNLYTNTEESRINDDYSINMVYLFGGFVGLVVILDSPSRIISRIRAKSAPSYPKIIATLGIFFMCISFALTHATLGKINKVQKFDQFTDFYAIFYPQGAIGMFFAISSSVLSSALWSILLNQHNHLHLTDFMGSSISAAIMYGTVAGFSSNISIPVTLGLGSGFLSIIYKSKLLPKLNKKKLIDSLGFLGPFFLAPIIGNYVVAPVVIYCYSSYNILTPQLGSTAIDIKSSRYVYIFYVLSSGLGILGGITVSSIFRWFKGNESNFGDRLTFVEILSLREFRLDYEQHSSMLFTPAHSSSQSSPKKKGKNGLPRKLTGRQSL